MKRLILAIAAILAGTLTARADEPPPSDLRPLYAKVMELVHKHYPKAKGTVEGANISFAFNTRKFWIHEPLLDGTWQDAFEEVGPQKGGILGTLELLDGQYGGMAVVPQAFDKRYFIVQLGAPYSRKLDKHLLIHLSYPRDASKEFLEAFGKLVNDFDRYVAAGK